MTHLELHEIQKTIIRLSHPEFQELYLEEEDNRRYRFCGAEQLEENFIVEDEIVRNTPELMDTLRDSKCRESVMWYVHHLRKEEKELLHTELDFVLPTLPVSEARVAKPEVVEKDPEGASKIHDVYEESLQCTTCHSQVFPDPISNQTWPSNAGINERTGEELPSWPDEFEVEFVLEVDTEVGQDGLPNIANATGNSFHYSYDREDPTKSRGVNIHETCPFFNKKSCNIHHHPDGIYLHINPGSLLNVCCKFGPVAVIPPFWTTWGQYVETYAPGDDVPGESAPNWEGYTVDRFIYGKASQLDEHDLHVRADDNAALVRFHATLPPPNDHSHGYWHVAGDMKEVEQDPKLFELPKFCIPTCFIGDRRMEGDEDMPQASAKSGLFPWAHSDWHQIEENLEGLFAEAEKLR